VLAIQQVSMNVKDIEEETETEGSQIVNNEDND
jgi:hypothetical protein